MSLYVHVSVSATKTYKRTTKLNKNIQKTHQTQQKHTKDPPKSTKTYKRPTKLNKNIQKTHQSQQKHTKDTPKSTKTYKRPTKITMNNRQLSNDIALGLVNIIISISFQHCYFLLEWKPPAHSNDVRTCGMRSCTYQT